MTSVPLWPALATRLRELPDPVERGLHFNLTEGRPLSPELQRLWPQFPSLPRLLVLAGAKRLPLAAIGAEWATQWARFVDATGRAPAFVDGHQHVHHLPGVRGIVLDAVARAQDPPAVRNTGTLPGPGHLLKRAAIRGTGGAALEGDLRRRGMRHNAVLLGAYDFRDHDYRALMRQWLAKLPDEGGLLFCHPAAAAETGDPFDPIAPARRREAAYLGSDDFLADLATAGVSLGSAWRRRSSGG
jgi:predicted glycoside hydrolase/deacetylase ChbG (UPF0249 family)